MAQYCDVWLECVLFDVLKGVPFIYLARGGAGVSFLFFYCSYFKMST